MPKNNNSPVDKNKSFSIQPSHILVNWDANEPNDVNDREDCAHLYNTVIPRLTRLEWQPKNRVKRNSRYVSQCIAKKIVKKICITRKFYTIKSCYANFFGQAQKTA